MYHIVSSYIRNTKVYGIRGNAFKYNSNPNLSSELFSNDQPILNLILITGK